MTGFISVDKAEGVSSAREVGAIKRLLNVPCGHMGTLDPMASGVLPIAVGNAARLFDFFLDKRKTYIATFEFGIDTDTLDITGSLLKQGGYVPTASQIESVLPSLVGEVMQVPPNYSAKCVNGRRGYQLARQGVEFTLPPKKVNIYSLDLLEKTGESSYKIKIECGGGTYVRSIGRDLAATLGTTAAMSALVRTASGPFTIENSVKSQQLTADNIKNYIIPTESVLPYKSVYPKGDNAKKLFNGLAIECEAEDGIYKIFTENDDFYGLATVEGGFLKVRKKLC